MSSIGPRPEGGLRILTLNIWARNGDWPARRSVLARAIRDLAPDLVALQESTLTAGYDQAADVLGDGFAIVNSAARAPDGVGSSIGSLLPIVASREIDLQVGERTADFPCTTLVVEVEAGPTLGRVVFANHLPSWQLAFEREREVQATIAARTLEALATGPGDRTPHVVLAGDLDAEPDAASLRFWTGRQSLDGLSVCYRSAWQSAHPGEPPAATFSPENRLQAAANWDWPFRAIDHILVRCGLHGGPTLAVHGCERFLDAPVDGVWASDHFGLVADLVPPPAPLVSPAP